MNVVVLMGRLAMDPETRRTQDGTAVTRYTLAVDRFKRGEADFIGCVAFGAAAEFAEKYFHKGMRVSLSGRIQTGNYTDRDGKKIYTTDVVVWNQEFAENKRSEEKTEEKAERSDDDGFMHIPDGIEEELPFA